MAEEFKNSEKNIGNNLLLAYRKCNVLFKEITEELSKHLLYKLIGRKKLTIRRELAMNTFPKMPK